MVWVCWIVSVGVTPELSPRVNRLALGVNDTEEPSEEMNTYCTSGHPIVGGVSSEKKISINH